MNPTTSPVLEGSTSLFKLSRQPAGNTSQGVMFILKGAEKRRSIAYSKAKLLQQELGVIPRMGKVTL